MQKSANNLQSSENMGEGEGGSYTYRGKNDAKS